MIRCTLIAAALAALAAGPAGAECAARLERLEEQAEAASQEEAAKRALMADLAVIARRLAEAGDAQGCATLATALEALGGAAADARPLGRTRSLAMSGLNEAQPAATPAALVTDAPPALAEPATGRRAEILARIVGFKQVRAMFDTAELLGREVYNLEGDHLGEVDGLLVTNGDWASHLIIGHGGFWGIGERAAAIPIAWVMWDAEARIFYLDLSPAELDSAPDYERRYGSWVVDANDAYFAAISE
ncbi:MAG TPA: PRC-barrel domain-containing protein [Paracoccaceae bacterium]|nr:PRC-barrel domain-containing protein [Paracoccaceae bacterium]